MHGGFDRALVDMATEWATRSSERYEALLMIALYKSHVCWRLHVVARERCHVNPPGAARFWNAATRRSTVAAPLQRQPTDQIRVDIAGLEAGLSQL